MPPTFRVRLTRDIRTPEWTSGVIELDFPEDNEGFLPFGFSCEDPERPVKVKGVTAIPCGVYAVRLYDSPTHGKDTPELVGVPGFQHVQIHPGNYVTDTEGCILPGLARDVAKRMVLRSAAASAWLCGTIRKYLEQNVPVTIEIRDAA